MKFIIVGLGSMGKRRIRCLRALGYERNDIIGFDLRDDRRREAEQKYGVKTYSEIEIALESEAPSVMIISVPPDIHHIYMKIAIERDIHFFVEASVVDTDIEEIIERLKNKNIVGVPSATTLFHPAIKIIKDKIETRELGKIANAVYHWGQYLPDWHTYEKVSDFYVSNPATGGGREIVPFELTWITGIFGFPSRVCGTFKKTINIDGAEQIDDTYCFILDYSDFLFSMTVDVVSRCSVHQLVINGDKKQLRWSWDDHCVRIYDAETKEWEELSYVMKGGDPKYPKNIGENHYIEEIRNFIEAIEGKKDYTNTLDRDHKVLKLLYAIEQSDKESKFVNTSFKR